MKSPSPRAHLVVKYPCFPCLCYGIWQFCMSKLYPWGNWLASNLPVWLNPGDLLGKLRLPPLSENCDLHTTMDPMTIRIALLNLAMNIISRVIRTASDDSCGAVDVAAWNLYCARKIWACAVDKLHVGLPYRRPDVDNGRSSKWTRA